MWTSVSQRLLCYSLVPQSVPLSGGCELLDGERPTWRWKSWGYAVEENCCLLSFSFPGLLQSHGMRRFFSHNTLPFQWFKGRPTDWHGLTVAKLRHKLLLLFGRVHLSRVFCTTGPIGQWSQLLGRLLRTVKLKVSGQIHWFPLLTAQIWTAQESWVFKRGFLCMFTSLLPPKPKLNPLIWVNVFEYTKETLGTEVYFSEVFYLEYGSHSTGAISCFLEDLQGWPKGISQSEVVLDSQPLFTLIQWHVALVLLSCSFICEPDSIQLLFLWFCTRQ